MNFSGSQWMVPADTNLFFDWHRRVQVESVDGTRRKCYFAGNYDCRCDPQAAWYTSMEFAVLPRLVLDICSCLHGGAGCGMSSLFWMLPGSPDCVILLRYPGNALPKYQWWANLDILGMWLFTHRISSTDPWNMVSDTSCFLLTVRWKFLKSRCSKFLCVCPRHCSIFATNLTPCSLGHRTVIVVYVNNPILSRDSYL
jgi:hypothetical protein